MNQINHRNDRRRSGWLLAPLLFAVALCANAATSTPSSTQSSTANNAQNKAQTPARKKTLALAQKKTPSAAHKKPLRLAQNDPPQVAAQNDTQAVPASSRSIAPKLQEVIVTGSRIARAQNDTLQPTVVITSATFEARGYTNVSQALDEMPQFGVPPTSQQNQQSAFSVGQSFVDLFSLGSQRTLTLVDGRRFVSSNTASLFGAASPGSQVDF